MKNDAALLSLGLALSALGGFLFSCAPSAPQTEAKSAGSLEEAEAPLATSSVEADPLAQNSDAAQGDSTDDESARSEPKFTPGMSVVDATNAVPVGGQRLDIEQEALAAPLMQPELYEPCGLQGHHHFKVKVAVWDGRAVGLDVTTQPNDTKLESCLRQQLSGVEWKDKAKSLNTVEYNY
jgi:hypothetical protein